MNQQQQQLATTYQSSMVLNLTKEAKSSINEDQAVCCLAAAAESERINPEANLPCSHTDTEQENSNTDTGAYLSISRPRQGHPEQVPSSSQG